MGQNVEFVTIEESELELFSQAVPRMNFLQLPAYARTKRRGGVEVEIVGIKRMLDGRRELLAAGVVTFSPWKRFFSVAHLFFGPTLNESMIEASGLSPIDVQRAFYEGLLAHLRAKPRVIAAELVPPVFRRKYSDVDVVERTAQGEETEALLHELGARRVEREPEEDPAIQAHFTFTKDIGGMSFDEVVSSTTQQARRAFAKWGKNAVSVEFVPPSRTDILQSVLAATAQRTTMDSYIASDATARYYRTFGEELGEGEVFFPVARLDTEKYLRIVRDEISQVERKRNALLETLARAHDEGREPGKKQKNQLDQLTSQLEAAQRRLADAEQIRAEHGDDVVLAASMFIHTPNELVFLTSGAFAEFNSLYGIYLIHRRMLEWSVENNVKWYNFWGIAKDFSPEADAGGVLKFKRHFNGDVEEYLGTYDAPIRPLLAKLMGALRA